MRSTRREFLVHSARLGVTGALVGSLPLPRFVSPAAAQAHTPVFLDAAEWATLQAAVARIVPAEGPGDWSGADAGAGVYIDHLLSTFDDPGQTPAIYAGGPFREQFPSFQTLSRVKLIGWSQEVSRLRDLYRAGLAELEVRAGAAIGGSFAAAPPATQEAILLSVDLEGSAFFDALYEHTMEGVYGHPVYGGNPNFLSWDAFCYQGDVHGVRFPDQLNPPGAVSDGSWNEFGGYAPEEMIARGKCPGQGPVKP